MLLQISIHAPARGATFSSIKRVAHSRISIHAPARGATSSLPQCLAVTKFQSTLPRGERLLIIHATLILLLFQSTLPRGERRDTFLQNYNRIPISIHAPARGATPSFVVSEPSITHFNPRSREGSDNFVPSFVSPPTNFNPRSREGSDHNFHALFQTYL